MNYREFTPAADLAGYVECFWTLEGQVAPGSAPERILPDGRPELVLNLADPFLRYRPGAAPGRQATSLLVGQITRPFLLQPTGRIDLVAVRFRPAALGPFLNGSPAHLHTDLDLALDDVVGARLHTLAEQMAAEPAAECRIAILEALLRSDIRRARPVDGRADTAANLIIAGNGMARIDDIATAVGSSARQLQRLFLSDVGIGPKRLARITRFQRLLARLGSHKRDGLARIALECGYYDQAHLIRDFREFTGGPPAAFPLDGAASLTEVFLRER